MVMVRYLIMWRSRVKTLFTVCIFFLLTTLSMAAEPAAVVYDGAVLTEDVTWRGPILVRGFVVVAPHATLRIEPGAVIRFAGTAAQQLPTLIIQGRLHAAGTSERPIFLASNLSKPMRGSWGGVVFLTTEKGNLLEHCRIENAEIGIDIRYSKVALTSVSIMQAQTALLSHDGIVQISGGTISDSETGIEIYNSEFDGTDMTIASCQRGCIFNKSAAVLVASKIINNQQTGFEADECRLKITGGEFSGNAFGAQIKGGEGQIFLSRFLRNGQTALHLQGSRIKIERSLFADNLQDALRTEDGQALFLYNAFASNGGYNLYNAGCEVVSARQNWWGGTDPSLIRQKIYSVLQNKNVGAVQVFPWLNEKPQLMQ